MSRARRELDRIRAEAWRGLVRDLRRVGRGLDRAAAAGVRSHPLLVLGGGAFLAALAASRLEPPAPRGVECGHVLRGGHPVASALLGAGRIAAARILFSSLAGAETAPSRRRRGSGRRNGSSRL